MTNKTPTIKNILKLFTDYFIIFSLNISFTRRSIITNKLPDLWIDILKLLINRNNFKLNFIKKKRQALNLDCPLLFVDKRQLYLKQTTFEWGWLV